VNKEDLVNPNNDNETSQKKPMSLAVRLIVAVVALLVGAMLAGRLAAFVEQDWLWPVLTAAGGYLVAVAAFWATGRRAPDSGRRILRWGLLLPACMVAAYSLTVWLGMALHDRMGYDLPRIGYRPITAWKNWRYVAAGAAVLAGLASLVLLRIGSRRRSAAN
jgi:hypothetical protein